MLNEARSQDLCCIKGVIGRKSIHIGGERLLSQMPEIALFPLILKCKVVIRQTN